MINVPVTLISFLCYSLVLTLQLRFHPDISATRLRGGDGREKLSMYVPDVVYMLTSRWGENLRGVRDRSRKE